MFCSRKRLLKLEKRGENGASQKERVFLLPLIFLRHNKDGGYNSTNIIKQAAFVRPKYACTSGYTETGYLFQ